jgi:hypothetical protein
VTYPGGPHNGDNNYVEVLVTEVHTTYFLNVVGIKSETVTARAVATNLSGSSPATNGCLYTIGPPDAQIEGVNINGKATLNAPTCGINDNGNYNTKGNALTVSADTFGVSGSREVSGPGGSVSCVAPGPCPAFGIPAVADPLQAKLSPPPQPAASPSCQGFSGCNVRTSGTITLQPGTYNTLDIGKNSTVTLSPGTYYIDGSPGVTMEGSATVKGSGVMFYFTGSATINAVGGGNQLTNIDLTPPTSGSYAGILFYQDPSDLSAPTLGGNDGSVFGGVAYFPSVEVTFFGTATNTAGIVITKAFALSGNPTVNLAGAASLPPGVNLITVATLVE